jgi:hypothetical protein
MLNKVRSLLGVRPATTEQPPLAFKDPDAALLFACENLLCAHAVGAVLPCVIDDVERSASGMAIASIRLAAPGKPVATLGAFAIEESYPEVHITDLYAAKLGPLVGGLRTVLLVAQLEPVLTAKGWKPARP